MIAIVIIVGAIILTGFSWCVLPWLCDVISTRVHSRSQVPAPKIKSKQVTTRLEQKG